MISSHLLSGLHSFAVRISDVLPYYSNHRTSVHIFPLFPLPSVTPSLSLLVTVFLVNFYRRGPSQPDTFPDCPERYPTYPVDSKEDGHSTAENESFGDATGPPTPSDLCQYGPGPLAYMRESMIMRWLEHGLTKLVQHCSTSPTGEITIRKWKNCRTNNSNRAHLTYWAGDCGWWRCLIDGRVLSRTLWMKNCLSNCHLYPWYALTNLDMHCISIIHIYFELFSEVELCQCNIL